jgi:hypothetical protein
MPDERVEDFARGASQGEKLFDGPLDSRELTFELPVEQLALIEWQFKPVIRQGYLQNGVHRMTAAAENLIQG